MRFPRASGILLHITSLPSQFGIGDLGPKAFEIVDFLARSKQRYWQILPLGQTGFGNSPYSCYSAFAGNIYLISPEKLAEDDLLSGPGEVSTGFPDANSAKIDYGAIIDFKNQLLRTSFETFRQTTSESVIGEFHHFCNANAFWLEDYSLYRAVSLKNDHGQWMEWDEGLKKREPEALENARRELDDEIFAQKFYQFTFFRQWKALKEYANGKGISIIGDIPIYVTA